MGTDIGKLFETPSMLSIALLPRSVSHILMNTSVGPTLTKVPLLLTMVEKDNRLSLSSKFSCYWRSISSPDLA